MSKAKWFVVRKPRALPHPYAEDYTNQEYIELDSSNDLTCRTLLGYWQYHFSKHTVLQKGNKLIY